ncbi:MAG: response regulator [Planctomycetales bacterium]|nr:response regulator [Planctomycetales bacterium]
MNVLIADDSVLMRKLLLSILEGWDYDVTEAEDGEEAWNLFQQEHFPLVLTDWMMPNTDGLELTRRIRASNRPEYVYIILLTAKSEKEDLILGLEAGADDYLAKPFDHGELRVRLREGERIIRLERTLVEQNRKLQETQAALVQSEKLASLGQLAAGMAHEINNPISYVTNNLAVLKRDMSDILDILARYRSGREDLKRTNGPLASQIEQLEQDADLDWITENLPKLCETSLAGLARVRDIVKNLRDFARLDEAEVDALDLNHALDSTIGVMQHEIDAKQITLDKQWGTIPSLLCQPAKIIQVLHNLVLNAVQASTTGGVISVRTTSENNVCIVEIEDRGCGIEECDLTRIFEPFYTTKPVGQGTGLGLAISYGIVRDHGGSIDVESKVGYGSTFRLSLPAQPPSK